MRNISFATTAWLVLASVAFAGPPFKPKPTTQPSVVRDYTKEEDATKVGMREDEFVKVWHVEPYLKSEGRTTYFLPDGISAFATQDRICLLVTPPYIGMTEEKLTQFNVIAEDKGPTCLYSMKSEDEDTRTYVEVDLPGGRKSAHKQLFIFYKRTRKMERFAMDDQSGSTK
ncbi:MAG TPA: hypothetical protein VFE47_30380 [Tepidisphaeraceae bacterium]|jgi:hypothetical protein|nr:hypothetical protein [Tepidisphaeraceae bacterium]